LRSSQPLAYARCAMPKIKETTAVVRHNEIGPV
jgi:hypothetical protein